MRYRITKSFLLTIILILSTIHIVFAEDIIVDTSNHTYTYEEMVEDIHNLDEKYPDRIEVSIIGHSVDKRPLYQVIIGNKDSKNAIYIQSTIHGREWMNTWVLMKSLEMHLDNS